MNVDDDNFRQFAGDLYKVIDGYGQQEPGDEALLRKQSAQFRSLVAMEKEFRETLIRSRAGAQVYRAFMLMICDKKEGKGNILTSRPYFRERQQVCIGPISQALKKKHIQSLYQFHFNYNFIAFALNLRKWPPHGRLNLLAIQIKRLRREIVELNMPLAISQARIFCEKAPKKTQDTRFTFMDFVQVAADGLLSAVDKFVVPPDAELNPKAIQVWRAVAIGRMKGNFIEMFSETSIHFFPQYRRVLYRANKHLHKFNGVIDFEVLAALVNQDLDTAGIRTTASELAMLMSAASHVGVVQSAQDEEDQSESPLDRACASSDWEPDKRFEENEAHKLLKNSFGFLTVFEQKLLKLKGIALDSI
jgi:hypothetical protein